MAKHLIASCFIPSVAAWAPLVANSMRARVNLQSEPSITGDSIISDEVQGGLFELKEGSGAIESKEEEDTAEPLQLVKFSTPEEFFPALLESSASDVVPAVVAAKRTNGAALLAAQDLPGRKTESWRHSNLNAFFGGAAALSAVDAGSDDSAAEATREALSPWLLEGVAQLVFLDGVYMPDLSDLAPAAEGAAASGAYVGALSELAAGAERNANQQLCLGQALAEMDYLPEISLPSDPRTRQGSAALAALNQACFKDAAVVMLPDDEAYDAKEAAKALARKEAAENDYGAAPGSGEFGDNEDEDGGGEGKNRRFRAAATMPEDALHVQLLFASSGRPKAAYPRALVKCGRGNALKLTQTYCTLPGSGAAADTSSISKSSSTSGSASFTDGFTRVVCGEGSRVAHEYVHDTAAASKGPAFYDAVSVACAKSADHSIVAFGLGGASSRVNYECVIGGENARTSLACVLLSDGRQSMDLHSSITHAAPNSQSFQEHRNLVADRSECIFKGRIRVDQAAQGTNSNQLCKSLLLSDNARVTVMPSMEIIADQVKCSHGATVADLSMEELFYLQSRGYTKDEGRALLIKSSVLEFSKKLSCKKATARIEEKITSLVPRIVEKEGGVYSSI